MGPPASRPLGFVVETVTVVNEISGIILQVKEAIALDKTLAMRIIVA